MRNTSDGIARMASKSRSLAGIMEDDFKFLTCTCSQGVANDLMNIKIDCLHLLFVSMVLGEQGFFFCRIPSTRSFLKFTVTWRIIDETNVMHQSILNYAYRT